MFLKSFGFTDDTIAMFSEHLKYDKDNECIHFSYMFNLQKELSLNRVEKLFIDKRNFIPAEFYNEIQIQKFEWIRTVYLFNSFTNAMAFFELKPEAFINSLFVICGSNPSYRILYRLKNRLPKSTKYRLVFPNNYLGKIMDIKATCFLKGIPEIKVYLKDDYLEVFYKKKQAKIQLQEVSLSRFKKEFSTNSTNIRTIKSKKQDTFFKELTSKIKDST